MIFLKAGFLSGKGSLYPAAEKPDTITSISISDGTHNHLYVSKNPDMTVSNWNDDWDYDTVMSADYNKNLDAGNSGFSIRNTDTVVVKRRELLDDTWTTIYTKDIKSEEDFNINIIDRYARGGDTGYIYRISSTINGFENSYVEQNVISSFDGMYIADKETSYGTIYDLDGCDTTQNKKTGIVETYDRYPTVVSNSAANYERGSIKGTFLVTDGDSNVSLPASLQYRRMFKDRLASGKPFILKIPDGRIWIAKCVGNPSDSMNGHRDIRQISFEWIEIGNVNDMEALYYNGLSDVPVRWWS